MTKIDIFDCLGVVHKLRWQDFGFFWSPTPLCWNFLPYECWHKDNIFGLDYLPPSSCERSLWTTLYPPLLVNVVCEWTLLASGYTANILFIRNRAIHQIDLILFWLLVLLKNFFFCFFLFSITMGWNYFFMYDFKKYFFRLYVFS